MRRCTGASRPCMGLRRERARSISRAPCWGADTTAMLAARA
ncbi:hypothetical protein C7S13_8772 [Burkholderia cepacia]|nr:hypothetical protein [Burkholderia cepacia]